MYSKAEQIQDLQAKVAQLERSNRDLQTAYTNVKKQVEELIAQHRDDIDEKRQLQYKANLKDREIETIRKDLEKTNKYLEHHREVARQRANREQDLRPAKKHSGYAVIRSETRLQRGSYRDDLVQIYITTLMTPISVDLPPDYAYDTISAQFPTDDRPDRLFAALGIDVIYRTMSYADIGSKDQDRNVAYDLRVRSDGQGYYTVSFSHTKPLVSPCPDQFRRPSGEQKNKALTSTQEDQAEAARQEAARKEKERQAEAARQEAARKEKERQAEAARQEAARKEKERQIKELKERAENSPPLILEESDEELMLLEETDDEPELVLEPDKDTISDELDFLDLADIEWLD